MVYVSPVCIIAIFAWRFSFPYPQRQSAPITVFVPPNQLFIRFHLVRVLFSSAREEVRSFPEESQQRYDPRDLRGLRRLSGAQAHTVQQLRHRQTVSRFEFKFWALYLREARRRVTRKTGCDLHISLARRVHVRDPSGYQNPCIFRPFPVFERIGKREFGSSENSAFNRTEDFFFYNLVGPTKRYESSTA